MQVNEYKVSAEEMWAYCCEVGDFRADVNNANGYLNKLKAIARYWRKLEPEIIEYSKPNPKRWFRTYPIDWSQLFTPVEQDAWIMNSGDGVIEALRVVYFIQPQNLSYELDHFVGLCYQTLEKHCTTGFDFSY